MATLPYGLKIPEVGERTWWGKLTDNFTRLDGHAHDGVDSAKISIVNLTKTVNDVLATNWVEVSGQAGTYRQLVTLPFGVTFPAVSVSFQDTAGNVLLLSVEKASSSTYYVYINDNTLNLKAIYA